MIGFQVTVCLQKSGYFSFVQYFGFMLLKRSVHLSKYHLLALSFFSTEKKIFFGFQRFFEDHLRCPYLARNPKIMSNYENRIHSFKQKSSQYLDKQLGHLPINYFIKFSHLILFLDGRNRLFFVSELVKNDWEI